MRRRARSLGTTIALVLTLWFVVTRLRFIVFVNVPWWGFLLLIVALFIAIDYVIDRVFGGNT